MSTATQGTINATDILRGHEARIIRREWKVVDDGCTIRIIGPDEAGRPRIIATITDAGREEADFIVDLRNTLPETIRSMDNRDFRIRYLEQRVRELEEQLEDRDNAAWDKQGRKE